MSFFKKLIKGIVIGAVVGLTGGLALSMIPGALGLTTLTGAALLKASAIYGAVYGGLQGASMGLIKKPKMPLGESVARQNVSVDPQALGKWVFGETALATDIVYAETIDDSAIVHVISAASHQIDSYGALYINDELVTFSGNQATGTWAGVLSIARNLGTQAQNALSIADSNWPAEARGLGMAHYALRWAFNTDAGKKQLSGGIPTRITQVGRACLCYDPRLDSTRGGSGAHRADDQTTWQWSANWALITAHYLLGWRNNGYLVYGVAIPPDDIDWVSVINMANVSDTVVDGKPKYRIGGIFAITQDHQEIIGQLEAAVGGKVGKFGGKYYLWCPHNDLTPAGTITEDMIVADAGIRFTPSGPIESLYNIARGRFIDPALLYQPAPYPTVTESAAVTDDGKERVMDHDFSIIQDVEIAQRVARELVRRTRFSATVTLVTGPIGLSLRPFDVVTLNIRETNNADELFRVVSMQYSGMGAVIIELLEEDASIYDVTADLGTTLTQLDPSVYDPTAQIAITGLDAENVSVARAGGGAVDAIRVFWDAPPGFVDYTEVGYRVNAGTEYTTQRNTESDQALILPAIENALYEIRARHITISGVPGEYDTTTITTGNADFDRVSFLGLANLIEPKLFIDTVATSALARMRVSVSYEPDPTAATPDRFLVFYAVSDVPNAIKATTDIGTRIYISTAVGEGVNSLFNLTTAAGSTANVLRYEPTAIADPDLYGAWWASVRNDPGAASRYNKVIEAADGVLRFAPDVAFGFTPVAGQLIDVAEVDYADGRVGEFKLAHINGEIVRHRGIQFDGTNYYLDVIERGAEGTVQANQAGQFIEYFPAPGPQTDIIEISAGEFTEENGVFHFSGRIAANVPASFGWLAVTCCLAKAVQVEGRQVFIRSNIVPFTVAGPT